MSRSNSRNADTIVFHGCTATSTAAGEPQAGGQRRQTIIKGNKLGRVFMTPFSAGGRSRCGGGYFPPPACASIEGSRPALLQELD